MTQTLPRTIIEAHVRNTLKSMKRDPERGIRNLVDMALHFSGGRFQKTFFSTAQTMLQNQSSAYHDLLRSVITNVAIERIITLGMNIGYNSCTEGAGRIRAAEEDLGIQIPWTVLLRPDMEMMAQQEIRYQEIIRQGESLGIYTWMLLTDRMPEQSFSFAEAHPDSAFILLCEPRDITDAFVDRISDCMNLMPVVRFDSGTAAACECLREQEIPYSVYYVYAQTDVTGIIRGDLFEDTQQLAPFFTVLIPWQDCPMMLRSVVYDTVVQTRNRQQYQTLPWDLYADNCAVDQIISGEPFSAWFNAAGQLCSRDGQPLPSGETIFQSSLLDVFRHAQVSLPKRSPA